MKKKTLICITPLLLSTVLVGCKKATTFSVTFNYNYSGCKESAVEIVQENKTVDEPTAPFRDGYSFKGWYLEPECTNSYNFKTPVTSSFTVYAGWTELNFEEKLKNLKDVTSVVKIDDDIQLFDECYTVKMRQYINHQDQSIGTFEQKFNVYYKKSSTITMYLCNGYNINSDNSTQFMSNELVSRYSSSVVNIEYRFFQNSCPTDFDPKGTKYYEYMNSYQASKDFYRIISGIQSIVNNKTIFTGGSKGGYTTEAMAYYYPNAIDAYISYVAPLCNGIKDENFYKSVYTTIGNNTYGEQKASEYRTRLLTFQKNALSDTFREKIKSNLPEKYADIEAVTTTKEMTEDEVYEYLVLELGAGIWQYYESDKFDEVDTINKMSESSENEKNEKAKKMVEMIYDISGSTEQQRINYLPYYVEALTEMGNYLCDYSYLRNAGANVKTDSTKDILVNNLVNLTKAQRDTLKYSSTMRDNLIKFFNNTTKDIIKIVGYSDPWYGVKAPTTTNTKVHLYEAKGNHGARIETLDDEKSLECFQIIDNLLSFTPPKGN